MSTDPQFTNDQRDLNARGEACSPSCTRVPVSERLAEIRERARHESDADVLADDVNALLAEVERLQAWKAEAMAVRAEPTAEQVKALSDDSYMLTFPDPDYAVPEDREDMVRELIALPAFQAIMASVRADALQEEASAARSALTKTGIPPGDIDAALDAVSILSGTAEIAALGRVKALHRQGVLHTLHDGRPVEVPICIHCEGSERYWPCATIRAVDGG